MKFLRFFKDGKEFYGIFKKNRIYAINWEGFTKEFKETGQIFSPEEIKFLPPCNPPNIIALGLNYKEHAEEGWEKVLSEPVIFLKATTSLTGHLSPIILPEQAPDEVDYECELVIVIGKKCKNIEEKEAKDYIFGYTCGNDVSARDCQLKKDKQWARAKSFDTFCPIGPWIETEIEPTNLSIKTILNGKIMQNSNTSKMIFNPYKIVSYLSKQMTLLPGTIILTGTPSGVGFARKPPVFLKEGDIVEVEIEGIGTLKNFVIKEK
ncbi:MAG TPA: fumarylacetoacetate hydrolase family protein [bacterium]|nr:fumarylacetoacetate hydrolase family protein [bacterium]HOM27756.1 fumarylacetoacetate hydrolase family protein [bacterium]